ncbi:MAG: hypothetical protein H0W72_02495 [Planctomycetes bacterium]|nr:hypothetical protein [Planctomycetota bacterium]
MIGNDLSIASVHCLLFLPRRLASEEIPMTDPIHLGMSLGSIMVIPVIVILTVIAVLRPTASSSQCPAGTGGWLIDFPLA